jgi:hypothetical protein
VIRPDAAEGIGWYAGSHQAARAASAASASRGRARPACLRIREQATFGSAQGGDDRRPPTADRL